MKTKKFSAHKRFFKNAGIKKGLDKGSHKIGQVFKELGIYTRVLRVLKLKRKLTNLGRTGQIGR